MGKRFNYSDHLETASRIHTSGELPLEVRYNKSCKPWDKLFYVSNHTHAVPLYYHKWSRFYHQWCLAFIEDYGPRMHSINWCVSNQRPIFIQIHNWWKWVSANRCGRLWMWRLQVYCSSVQRDNARFWSLSSWSWVYWSENDRKAILKCPRIDDQVQSYKYRLNWDSC